MATIRRRNGKYQVTIRRRGSPHLSKTFISHRAAKIWARQKNGEIDHCGVRYRLSHSGLHWQKWACLETMLPNGIILIVLHSVGGYYPDWEHECATKYLEFIRIRCGDPPGKEGPRADPG